jgi:SNF2 family DNA or RNA helicase
MKQDLLTCVEGKGVAVAQLALTKMLRMQQIISGHVNVERFGEDGATIKENYRIKDNPRARALEETLETLTLQHKVIVWAIFKTDYDIIRDVCEKLKIECVEVHGGISQKQKDIAVNRFNTEENVRVFIGHPQSGGIGINLVVSDITIYYSRSFNLADDIQSEARNYRGGSERHESVTRIDIVADKTVDELVLERLLHKQQIGDDILINLVKELREHG